MQFEFDPRKSEINKAKHGIDFSEAQALWISKVVVLAAKDALRPMRASPTPLPPKSWR